MSAAAATQWVVTAAQKESRLAAARRPWGTVHVKRSGALFTACGEPAANWFVFWDYRMIPGAPESCRECSLAIVGRAPTQPQPSEQARGKLELVPDRRWPV